MLGVFSSNVTTKFVQLLYIIFYHKILGRQKTSCLPLSKLPPETRSLNGTRRLLHRLVKQKQLRLSFIALWWQNGSFQSTQSCQFLNLYFFWSHLWSWILGNDWKSTLKYKRQRWIFTEFTVWHFATKCAAVKFAKLWMSSYSSESRDTSWVDWAICPECPRKDWQGKSFWLPHGKAVQRLSKDQVERPHLRPYLVPSWCGANRTIGLLLTVRYFETP